MAYFAPTLTSGVFQSSPALSSGRYTTLAYYWSQVVMVSILARPFERALPYFEALTAKVIVFQSSPALSSGRYLAAYRCSQGLGWFQSSPALSSGRYADDDDDEAMMMRFNPRPPFRAGATESLIWLKWFVRVSILARPFERALHA